MPVVEVKHPLLEHKLGLARQEDVGPKAFRELVSEIGLLLMYEATRALPTEPVEIQTWSGTLEVKRIAGKKLTLVPVLRAGLLFLHAALRIVPNAKVSTIGAHRDEETLEPDIYFERFATDLPLRTAIVLDPMLATGGTLAATLDLLKGAGCQRITSIHLIATPEGVARVESRHSDVDIFTASLDQRLTRERVTFPGLGDAGDRGCGTRIVSARRRLAAERLRRADPGR